MNSSNSIPRDRIGMDLLQCFTNSKGRQERWARRLRWKGKKQSPENKLQSTCHLDKLIYSLPKTQPDIFIYCGGGTGSNFWFMESLKNLLLNSTLVIKSLDIAILKYFRQSIIKSPHLLKGIQPFPISCILPLIIPPEGFWTVNNQDLRPLTSVCNTP